jgi:hypothetical protein
VIAPGCPTADTLARHQEGELTRNESEAVLVHLAGCAACRADADELDGIVAAIARAPELPELDLVAGVRARAALPRPRTSLRWVVAVPALAAAAALLVLVRPLAGQMGAGPVMRGVVARGGATPAEAWVGAWVGVRLFGGAGGVTRAVPAGGTLPAKDGLLVAYDNGGPSPAAYLMVFLVDARRHVYWLYPALGADGADAPGLPIHPGVGVELPDEIRHDLSPGPLRVFSVFSHRPLRVREVERAVGTVVDPVAAERLPTDRLACDDCAQHSFLVHVVR